MRVLIATDGSPCSRQAIDEFCRMFEKADNVEIKVASTYEGALTVDAFGTMTQNAENIFDALQEQAERVVAEAGDYIRARLPQARIETEIGMDIAERFIVGEADEWNPNLIVVGSHGRGFWGRMTLGSVSDAVVRHAPCSVLVARSKMSN